MFMTGVTIMIDVGGNRMLRVTLTRRTLTRARGLAGCTAYAESGEISQTDGGAKQKRANSRVGNEQREAARAHYTIFVKFVSFPTHFFCDPPWQRP